MEQLDYKKLAREIALAQVDAIPTYLDESTREWSEDLKRKIPAAHEATDAERLRSYRELCPSAQAEAEIRQAQQSEEARVTARLSEEQRQQEEQARAMHDYQVNHKLWEAEKLKREAIGLSPDAEPQKPRDEKAEALADLRAGYAKAF
jgi:hypothetical protein